KARDWFLEHKRDPFLWLVILGPLTLAAFTFWGVFLFPPSDALRAISQVLPNTEIRVQQENFPKCSGKKYSFGYVFATGRGLGRACRDIVNGGWVVDIPK